MIGGTTWMIRRLLPVVLCVSVSGQAAPKVPVYVARGIGGGGAMAGFSISPYARLWFVGTDMGTLFRSTDQGRHWDAVPHDQTGFGPDLENAGSVGFSSDPNVVFHAVSGKNPRRSTDGGKTWSRISIPLNPDERIRYWQSDAYDRDFMLAATTQGLLRSTDRGRSWDRVFSVEGDARGTFIDYEEGRIARAHAIYHAVPDGILISRNHARSFERWYRAENAHARIRAFAGGSDSKRVTLSFVDNDGAEACAWADQVKDVSPRQRSEHQLDCGFVWIASAARGSALTFTRSNKDAGRFVRMAENDPETIWITAGNWIKEYGTKVWVSRNHGRTWDLRLHLYDWDQRPFRPWPSSRLQYSAVGLDVGWDDNAYYSFSVNPRNSSEAGGTGNYFLHVSSDYGATWKAPFTSYADRGERMKGKRWSSTGLEVTSVTRLKFHPVVSKLGYAAVADIGGLVTEDGGDSWRITKAGFNTNYDYAFDPRLPDVVFAASGSVHDFPLGFHGPVAGAGGIFRSEDRGMSWHRLTPGGPEWNRQFISVAYDPIHKILYGGTQGGGVGRSSDRGKTWTYYNDGLPRGDKIISQLETDPETGDVYALLSGSAPEFRNASETGIYYLPAGKRGAWKLLRGEVRRPESVADSSPLWMFPSAFAVDFSYPGRTVLWLTDMEERGAWMASGVWKSVDRGKHWRRTTQFTHPAAIAIDPERPETVHVAGTFSVDGSWGTGGALVTSDGGIRWKKNSSFPLLANLCGVTLDPVRSDRLYYLFFGGGMLYGERPR